MPSAGDLAYHDALTALPDRAALDDALEGQRRLGRKRDEGRTRCFSTVPIGRDARCSSTA